MAKTDQAPATEPTPDKSSGAEPTAPLSDDERAELDRLREENDALRAENDALMGEVDLTQPAAFTTDGQDITRTAPDLTTQRQAIAEHELAVYDRSEGARLAREQDENSAKARGQGPRLRTRAAADEPADLDAE